ncbi:DUF2254 domain-containing protein [Sphingomonas sp. IC-11]|uniref:DUF2254 domain-containing protein n=1 Tax=Sphingomonas sp. IC-11 TaxID=2898528 RepID=UPI001E3058AA|nr:DUF2254 domain-containing protein [Sphingomonas sp. IC-11]MCD2317595.1 DUF2254 domain-containing protein [Sphingomonas sp. IC-11]
MLVDGKLWHSLMESPRITWDRLRTSFWFVPSLMALASVGLVTGTFALERRLTLAGANSPWFLYVGDPADAQSVLSTLLASMITMASLVFSITMVVLTLAASQFGPRLIRSFMANLQTQVVLGAFVMTIVYCLLALPAIEAREEAGRLPYVSVSVALALTVISVGLLVLFLDTLARSIVSETVIERVGHDLDLLLDEFVPLDIGSQEEAPAQQAPADLEHRAAFFGPKTAGYVQAIEYGELTALATKADVVVIFYFRAGHYVVPGAPEIAVYPKERLTEELASQVRNTILVGVHRTPIQDADFSIRHLDEIAVRALSAAVNDPYTAVAVIDRLSASLSKLMSRALPPGVFRDESGTVRVLSTEASYEGLIGAAFNQIRQHGAGIPIIALHLLEAIERIAQHVLLPSQHAVLCAHAAAIHQMAHRRIEDDLDRQSIDGRYAAVQRTLAAATTRWTGDLGGSPPPQ